MFKIVWDKSINKDVETYLKNSKESSFKNLEKLITKKNSNDIGFIDLPKRQDAIKSVNETASYIKENYNCLMVLGIGGSSLGGKAIISSLASKESSFKVLFVDNIDPDYFMEAIKSIDLEKTAFNVISKSGSTAETMSQFLVIFDMLTKKLGKEEAIKRVIFTTDPEKGALRPLCKEFGFRGLDIPSNVGGRFSVLTEVGLLPAKCAGINIEEMLSGANEVAEAGLKFDTENPVLKYSLIKYLYYLKGLNNSVMMPYSTKLYEFSNWYVQLWAESLGKMGLGQTPIPAVGATDQHSQLQLFMAGPKNKFITFIGIENNKHQITIPKFLKELEAFTYLSGHTINELIRAEMLSTEKALFENNVPSVRIELEKLDSYNLGALFMFFEMAVAYTGELLAIDAFDQPGVELSKKYTYQMMGRKGY